MPADVEAGAVPTHNGEITADNHRRKTLIEIASKYMLVIM